MHGLFDSFIPKSLNPLDVIKTSLKAPTNLLLAPANQVSPNMVARVNTGNLNPFTVIKNVLVTPVKIIMKADPGIQRLTTGHLQGGFAGFHARIASSVHEEYQVDPVAKRLGVKESDITNAVIVAAIVVATYFTAGYAAGYFSTAGSAITSTLTSAGLTSGQISSLEATASAAALAKAKQALSPSKAALPLSTPNPLNAPTDSLTTLTKSVSSVLPLIMAAGAIWGMMK
jgi:hypothetical protein